MQNDNQKLLTDVAEYYSSKLATHGTTPKGVDWNGEEGQTIRFEQLCKIIRSTDAFSINDLGCGYGALLDYLSRNYSSFSYHGVDVSEAMIRAAKEKYNIKENAQFIVKNSPDQVSDFSIASGIFNVRQNETNEQWRNYIESTLDILERTSRLGFAFNCLTDYSDSDRMRKDLYYASPTDLFDFCKRRYSKNVALLHDYDLYEFTILVRKA